MALSGLGLAELAGLGPVGALVGAVVVVAVADAVGYGRRLLAGTTVASGLLAAGSAGGVLLAGVDRTRLFNETLVVDGLALVTAVIVGSVVAVVGLASYDYLHEYDRQGTYYTLVGLAATGMVMMALANSFAVAFVSVELASLASYALVGALRTDPDGAEGALKYFVVGAVASAVFVYGISLVYATTGALGFEPVTTAVADSQSIGVLGVGVVFVVGGLTFKTASVPFHFWAPDAYEGAPTPVSALLASASTAAGVALLFRVVTEVFGPETIAGGIDVVLVVQVLAVVTMTVGNLAALRQTSVKRMLAYSSVGQAGYALIGVAALTGAGDQTLAVGAGIAHLLVYGAMNTGAFLCVALAETWGVGPKFEDYQGLARRAPFASVAMTIFLFSLAGLPTGGGILSKLYLLVAAVDGGVAILAGALVANSVVSVFYYTRLVRAMWVEEPDGELEITEYPTGLYAALAVTVLATVLLLPGFGLVVEVAEGAAESLVA